MMLHLLWAACLFFTGNAFANEKINQAEQAYALRDYDQVGTDKAKEAATLYEEALTDASEDMLRKQIMVQLSSVYYFLGVALTSKSDQISNHELAMAHADVLIESMGVSPTKVHELTQAEVNELINNLDEENELILAEALYSKGISLAQWGNLKGIASSLDKLPVVLGIMERIEMMGYQNIHEYGPYRTIGRIYFKLPGFVGGDLDKSEHYLKEAFKNSIAPGQKYSINAYNNIYVAETLYKRGKELQAQKILELFISADPTTLTPNYEPENREALRIAKELADDWK